MFAASKSGKADSYSSPSLFPYVPLLLETTTTNGQQNNTFLDSSTNNFTITRNGTPTQGSVTPYWPNGYWSTNLNGSTDTLTTVSGAMSYAGDFSIECWFNTTTTTTYACLYSDETGSTGGTILLNNGSNNGQIVVFIGSAVSSFTSSSTGLNNGTWNHVALTRSGSTVRLFINGALQNTTTASGTITTTSTVRIGSSFFASRFFGGYISNFRIVVGSAVYTAAFTPSTTPLTAITNTSLLTCQSNRFIDNSANNRTITVVSTPKVQAFQPFSPAASYTAAAYGGSGYNGTKTDYLSIANTAAVKTYTGDFTMECWVNPTDTSLTSGWGIIDTRTTGSTATSWVWSLTSYTSAGWIVQMYAGAAFNFTLRVLPYVWSHVVLQRNGGTLRCFVNGVVDSTALSFTGTLTGGSGVIAIGNTKDSGLAGYGNVGYISNLRVVNGTAVYSTSGFTVPTTPLTAIPNTSLLLNYTNAGIYDAAVQNNQITVGDAQASTTQSKWSPTSMKFDGAGDWLTTIDKPQLQLGTGDFTIDGWVYLSATGVAYGLISKGAAATGWSVNVTSGNKLQFSYTASNLTGATSLAATTWYYFAVVRSGSATGNLKVYLNGSVDATSGGAVTDNFNQTDILYVGASRTGATPLNGYLQDVRITRFARTITTPTAAFPTR